MVRSTHRKVLTLLKDRVSVIRFSNIRQCENQAEAIESCAEKCTNLCRVYKLIMISRVPGYGQLEYLVLEYHVNLITLLLINVVGFNYLIGIGMLSTILDV